MLCPASPNVWVIWAADTSASALASTPALPVGLGAGVLPQGGANVLSPLGFSRASTLEPRLSGLFCKTGPVHLSLLSDPLSLVAGWQPP